MIKQHSQDNCVDHNATITFKDECMNNMNNKFHQNM